MANSVEDALNRGSAEQRDRANQVIEEARRNINTASLQKANFSSSDADATIARNEQIIEEAKRTIPVETMQHVTEVSSPALTPPTHGNINRETLELQPETSDRIESIQQGGGNNYLNRNAVDRALARQGQEPQQYEQPQQQQDIER